MKAIMFLGANKVECVECTEPQKKEGFALIKVKYAGICGTDLNIYAGTHPRAKEPLIIGHEFSGVLMEDTDKLKAGTRVTAYPLISCMKCTSCINGNKHVCNTLGLYGIDEPGGMAEYVLIPNDQIIPLPDDVSDKLGAFIEPIAVAVHTLRETQFIVGSNALIFGCGTIGLCLALALKNYGVGTIILAETDESRINVAKELGFEVINPAVDDLKNIVEEKTNGDGFDFVYDCAGVQAVANILLDVVKVKGKIVIVASYKKPPELPLFKGMAKELNIQFVRVYRQNDFELATTLAQKEPLFEKIITNIFSPEQVDQAFDILFTKGSGAIKAMFKF